MGDLLRGALLGGVRRVVNDRENDAFAHGFEEAAGICLGLLSKSIEGLMDQIKSGKFLSDQEQFLLLRLNEMKSETEGHLRDFWDSVATDEESVGRSEVRGEIM
ncbi:hypothetical protein AB0J82_16365 [Asanoa sp. NPDC049518]|uniref:hypothetical protein n=1 Tax=unclassified Asanoa TaxID=2685164 RepID=UPI00341AC1F7